MAADAASAEGGAPGQRPSAIGRIIDLGAQALPAVGGAVGFLGFVAAVGGAIEWTRFSAAGLPADQAVRVVPKQELVAIGAVALGGFVVLGLLALLLVYVLDSRGEPSAPARRGLAWVVSFELAVALWYADLHGWRLAVAAAWVIALAVLAGPTLDAAARTLTASRRRHRHELEVIAADLEKARLVLAAAADRCSALEAARASEETIARARDDRGLAAGSVATELRRLHELRSELAGTVLGRGRRAQAPAYTSAALLRRARQESGNIRALLDDPDRWRPRPWQPSPTKDVAHDRRIVARWIMSLGVLAGLIAVSLDGNRQWLLLMLLVAVVLAAAVLGVAASTSRFGWYGVAVFFSVPLYGAALSTDRTFRDPKVQPAALVRKSSDLGMCGVYVTQTSDRVYLGRVEPALDPRRATAYAGRVFWVPLSDVDVVSVGPLQAIASARWRARGLLDEVYADRPEVPAAKLPEPRTTVATTAVSGKAPDTTTRQTTTTRVAAAAPASPTARTHPFGLPSDGCTDVSLRTRYDVASWDAARRAKALPH